VPQGAGRRAGRVVRLCLPPRGVPETGLLVLGVEEPPESGLQGGWQNHSGADYVGAPLWDLYIMMRDLDPQHIGVCFDIGHATLEGGLSWPVQARLMEPYYVAVFLKDFYWEKTEKGWAPRWCAFGEGSVQKSFLTNLKKSAFTGPLCQHHEYKDLGTGPAMIANMKKDLAKLREWLA